MSNRNYNKIIEGVCQSVDCRKPLTEYEINRQKLSPRTFKYRFCRKCRQKPDHCSSAVRWRCRLCPHIMCASDTLRGRYYCEPCAELEGKRRSRLKAKYFLRERGCHAI
jgi:hypothetical protein